MNRPPPDAFDLELLELGAIEDPARAAEVAAARDGPLRGEHAAQEATKAWWAAHGEPLRSTGSASPEPSRATPPPSRSWSWRPVVAVLAMAAALLLAVVWAVQGPAPIRAMGEGLPVDLVVVRDGRPVQRSWSPHAGDVLHLAYLPPADGFADVVVVGEDGVVSVLVAGDPVSSGRRAELPGGAVLDDDLDQEWLVVSIGEIAHSRSEAADAARALLPDPTAAASDDRFVLDVTRGGR